MTRLVTRNHSTNDSLKHLHPSFLPPPSSQPCRVMSCQMYDVASSNFWKQRVMKEDVAKHVASVNPITGMKVGMKVGTMRPSSIVGTSDRRSMDRPKPPVSVAGASLKMPSNLPPKPPASTVSTAKSLRVFFCFLHHSYLIIN